MSTNDDSIKYAFFPRHYKREKDGTRTPTEKSDLPPKVFGVEKIIARIEDNLRRLR